MLKREPIYIKDRDMAIVQRIEFKSPNRYFAGFLQNAINSSGVKGSVEVLKK